MLSKLRLPWVYLMGLALLFSFTACNNDDDDITVNEDKTIVEVASEDARFTTLVSALQRTGLDAVLSDENASFTVFAPTNDAFDALGVDLSILTDDELKTILLYHVFGESFISAQILEGKTYLNSASTNGPDGTPLTVFIERTGSTVMINGTATVTQADIGTENGVIHVINQVLLPLDVVGHITANDDFNELVAALGSASGDLTTTLGSTSTVYTIFAPINSAFTEISTTLSGLTPDQVADVLTYHVAAGANVRSTDLSNGQTVGTVQGENITVNITDNTVTLTDANGNSATVLLADVQGTNGVIHIIDKVLIPSNL
ncbi:MAG: fasciclin domain-containing protein [Saprospiraceae bacterium]|nr:fasciclin domain-containing protein [Lewinella sp.]